MPEDVVATSPARAREVILARILGALLGLLLVLGGPVGRQVFGLSDRHLSQWVMFRGIGLTLIDARFLARDADGGLRRLDRHELLSLAPGESPLAFRRLRSATAVEAMGRRLCSALGTAADVRIVSRVATRRGWAPQLNGEVDVCAMSRDASAPSRPALRSARPEAAERGTQGTGTQGTGTQGTGTQRAAEEAVRGAVE